MMTYPSSTEPDLLMEARVRQIPKNYVAYPDQEIKEGGRKMTEYPQGEISNCDKCGTEMWFGEGTVYYSNGIPLLLCPECAEKKDREDFGERR